MKIGVFGGSFDPIHMGHMVLAEYVKDGLALDKVLLRPAYESPFKIGESNADSLHRFKMVKLAAEGNSDFEVSDYELRKSEISYTVDTLRAFREHVGHEHEIYFIAGTDSFLGMEKWKGAYELFTEYSFAIGNRPGYMEDKLCTYADYLREKYGTDIEIDKIPQIDLSSTEIRNRISVGRSIKYLVASGVENYITENSLYKK